MTSANGSRGAARLAVFVALLAVPATAFARAPLAPTVRSHAPARALLRVQLQRDARSLVVGQAVPVTIRADFLGGTGVTLNGLPRLVSDGFTLAGVSDKPRQTVVRRDGLPYTELTWTGVLTPIQAGASPPAVELPVELSYREPVAAPPRPGNPDDDEAANPFGTMFAGTPFASDPFFAQMLKDDPFSHFFQDFGGAVRQRDVTLRDQPPGLTVAAPPQPAAIGYAGAVGTFRATSSLSPAPFRVGEPITLTVRVEGHGSFDRLTTSAVASSDNLSTYAPTATFAAGSQPTAGTKTFKQTLVPRKSGPLEIPAVTLVTFDPQHHRYVTQRTRPFSATIAPAADAQPDTASGTAQTNPAEPSARATESRWVADATVRPLIPAIRQPWFWWVATALVAAAMLASLVGSASVRHRAGQAIGRLDRRRVVMETRRRMDAAVAAGDAPALFGAARDGLQSCLAKAWSMPAEAISAVDVDRRLGASGQGVREIFERADAWSYGRGARPAAGALEHWRDVAARELDALKEVA